MKKYLALAAIAALNASPALAGWTVERNEPDPFGPKGTTAFVAGEGNSSRALSIRCLEGKISLELVIEAFGVSEGERASVKLVADSKDILEDNDAQVVEASTAFTAIQFGDENTLNYLKGTQKLSVRAGVRGSYETVSFASGKPMDAVIDKALKACGMSPPARTTRSQNLQRLPEGKTALAYQWSKGLWTARYRDPRYFQPGRILPALRPGGQTASLNHFGERSDV
jgi:hypothetical protein